MPAVEWLLPSIVFGPFAAAAAALGLGRLAGRRAGLLMVLAAAASFGQALVLAVGTWGAAPIGFTRAWLPSMGIALSLQADPFGLFFALLISGIGTLVGIYSLGYMSAKLAPSRLGQYYAALLAFMGSMLGVALAEDLIVLFVCWEITSITSFLLIGFWYEEERARHGAMTALQVTAIGGLSMMAGFVLIGVVTGTFSLTQLAGSAALQARMGESGLATAALLLVLGGALTKSAQWPFHFWLPGAMVAPTPISTYLHAATMVKAGIFLLGRMLPIFGSDPAWSAILIPIGLLTFALGAFQAFLEFDLKAILARTTLSTLGLVTMLYGLGAAHQDALQILSHAAYKGALFLVAGIVEHATHTRDIRLLGGLRHRLPMTFWVCVLAALSMAGLPPFLGFLSKELLYADLLHTAALPGTLRGAVLAVAVLANACLFAVSFTLVIRVFLGPPTPAAAHAHEGGAGLWAPAGVLAATALALGLAAPWTGTLVTGLASRRDMPLHLSLVPHEAGPLLLSLVTVILGVGIYLGGGVLAGWRERRLHVPGMQGVWDGMIAGVTWVAETFSAHWQNGSLRWYFSGTLGFTVGLSTLALWRGGISPMDVPISLAEMQWYGLLLCAMLTASAVMVVRSRTRIGSAIALTTNGFLTALLFVVYRSPDILLTQILIESVSTIFLLLILYFMPPFGRESLSAARRLLHVGISAAVGLAIFAFILLSTSPQFRETRNLAEDYLRRSLAEAGGANAVNVIIVDFRAIDTNGEITVLLLVGLLAYGLLRSRRTRT